MHDLDRVGPFGTPRVVVSSNTSLEEDPNDPYYPGTPFGGDSQKTQWPSYGLFWGIDY